MRQARSVLSRIIYHAMSFIVIDLRDMTFQRKTGKVKEVGKLTLKPDLQKPFKNYWKKAIILKGEKNENSLLI